MIIAKDRYFKKMSSFLFKHQILKKNCVQSLREESYSIGNKQKKFKTVRISIKRKYNVKPGICSLILLFLNLCFYPKILSNNIIKKILNSIDKLTISLYNADQRSIESEGC